MTCSLYFSRMHQSLVTDYRPPSPSTYYLGWFFCRGALVFKTDCDLLCEGACTSAVSIMLDRDRTMMRVRFLFTYHQVIFSCCYAKCMHIYTMSLSFVTMQAFSNQNSVMESATMIDKQLTGKIDQISDTYAHKQAHYSERVVRLIGTCLNFETI